MPENSLFVPPNYATLSAEHIEKQVLVFFDFESTVSKENLHWLFFPIRAYVIEKGGEAKNLGIRARTLANLTESLLLPVPLFVFFLGIHIVAFMAKSWICFPVSWAWVISLPQHLFGLLLLSLFFLGAAYAVHYLLIERYFQLERYWVRHFYRAFLVMQNDSLEVSKK